MNSAEKHELQLIQVAATWPKLVAAAAELNAVSDELNSVSAAIEKHLSSLNLGIEVLVVMSTGKHYVRWFGYGKIEKRWGLKIIDESVEVPVNTLEYTWANAPRWMRIDALAMLPELLEAMLAHANGLLVHVADADTIVAGVREGLRLAQERNNEKV